MPSLLVVEDNAILATTLTCFLGTQRDLTVTATVPTAEAALDQLPHLLVDLMLIDVALPGMNGIDLVATLQRHYPTLACLVLSGHNEIGYVGCALAAGAKGYVVKGNPRAILAAVQSVLAGEIYLSEELRSKKYY